MPGKKFSFFVFLFCLYWQHSAGQGSMPVTYRSTDVAYAIERIPTVSFEHFYKSGDKLMSWHVDLGYQLHYYNTLGFLFTDDDVSEGVYQGPAVRIGKSFYAAWKKKKWHSYFSPALAVKYLWYESANVNRDNGWFFNQARVQSEKCVELSPQFYLGQKRVFGHFCLDYYFGFQLPVKFRDKTITQVYATQGASVPQVPYTSPQVSPGIDAVFGVKLGYLQTGRVRVRQRKAHAEKAENGMEEKKDKD